MRNTYLVCYDITDDKRRERVFKVCKNHGEHLQFSVFECDLNAMELAGLATGTDGRNFAIGRPGVVCEPWAIGGARGTRHRRVRKTVHEVGLAMLRGLIDPPVPATGALLFDNPNREIHAKHDASGKMVHSASILARDPEEISVPSELELQNAYGNRAGYLVLLPLSRLNALPIRSQSVTRRPFPRSKDRGSVEAWSAGTRSSSVHPGFRGRKTAAPLKQRHHGQDRRQGRRRFRGRKTAAPLKRDCRPGGYCSRS